MDAGRRTEPDALRVRRCTVGDVARIAAGEPEGKDYARRTFARQSVGECAYLVAWIGDEPVGSGELEWAPVPELKNLQVAPPHRGRGIGSAIVAAAEAEAAAFTRIWIGVSEDNPDARRLYERLGYTPTGRTETYSYTYVDSGGVRRSITETAEYLEKRLEG